MTEPGDAGPTRGFFAGVLLVGFAVIGLTLWWSDRQPPSDPHAHVQPMAGPSARTEPPWVTERREAAERALEANPNDLPALNMLTQVFLAEPERAMGYNRRALEVDPNDPDARTLQAALTAAVGMHERALERLDEVLADHPDHPRALTYKGLVALEAGAAKEAVSALEKVLAIAPDDPGLNAALDEARRQLGEGALRPAGSVVVSGTIALDPAREGTLGAAVFVSLRDPTGGPPLAAVRLPPGPFPLRFQVTDADAIAMGGAPRPIPAVFDLSIRLDQDGNAMSRAAGEPEAVVQGARRGSTGLALILR